MAEWVAIVGSRDWPDEQAVLDVVDNLPSGTTVVSGGARGVDDFAKRRAIETGLTYIEIPALWGTHGKAAGPIRNEAIIRCCDRVVAFHRGNSPGTRSAIELARRYGKPVEVVR